jgi:uncharacterized protein (TIGR00255 family)
LLRDLINSRINRGKVDATLRLKVEAKRNESSLELNEQQLSAVLQACTNIEAKMDNPGRINPLAVLQWPGVLQPAEINVDEIRSAAMALLEVALNELLETREREGNKIAGLLRQRCQAIRDQLKLVREHLPDIMLALRQRLQQRLAEVSATLDNERLEQEMVFIAQKMDVDEELDRLDLHLTEMVRVLSQTESVGRRLDFLMQELNREINTLASKSVAGVTSQAAVEMKVLVEQMREQIQNIE